MRYALKDSWLGVRNSTTRLPFRYGAATLSRCPQAVLEVEIEAGGRASRGWSGDCLPPGWFDKSPGRPYRDQVADMIASIALARSAFAEVAERPIGLFESWRAADRIAREAAARCGFPPLLAGFGVSLVERALIDALARSAGVGFAEAVRGDLLGIDAGAVHRDLAGHRPGAWLPRAPLRTVLVRHTVGLSDPLTAGDLGPDERVLDGLPRSLDEHLERGGLRFFKVKLSGDPRRDRERLVAVAEVIERSRGPDYRLTLDGNEQFGDGEALRALVEALVGEPRLRTLAANVLAIEQPLDRSIALDEPHGAAIRAISAWRPVIIDESDGEADAYPRALAFGYRGVTSKNCKGPLKAILNAGLTWLGNDRGRRPHLVMTAEDLCSVGVVALQADLCLAATLGLGHVERNGHHYHPGLSYLPEADRRAALAAHPDLYADRGGLIGPDVREGRLRIGSLRCAGFGFAALPQRSAYEEEGTWRFESLGLAD